MLSILLSTHTSTIKLACGLLLPAESLSSPCRYMPHAPRSQSCQLPLDDSSHAILAWRSLGAAGSLPPTYNEECDQSPVRRVWIRRPRYVTPHFSSMSYMHQTPSRSSPWRRPSATCNEECINHLSKRCRFEDPLYHAIPLLNGLYASDSLLPLRRSLA